MSISLNEKERDVLRGLVDQYMTIATLPVQKEKIELWKSINRGKMVRPMVLMDQLPWNELENPQLQLQISNPYWRNVEKTLRQTLYKWNNFPVDMVVDPFIPIEKVIKMTGYGLEAEVKTLGEDDSTAKAQKYTNQLKTLEDVEKIKMSQITHDKTKTEQRLIEANNYFGDLAPAVAMGHIFHLGVWDYITSIMSVENAFYAFVDNPQLLHAAMERLTNSVLCAIEDADDCGAHGDNVNLCHCSHIYTDELLPGSGQGKGPKAKNCWAFGLAQLFTSVSPDTFEEFEFPYISRMAEKFGAIYYGCCDRLDDRLHIVKRIPNVRKVSCSPWSNHENFAKNIGTELTMSVKPNPAHLAGISFKEDEIENELRNACELAVKNNVNIEFILKDVSTIKDEPNRLQKWADIAMQVVNDFIVDY